MSDVARRLLDIAVASAALIVLSPVLALTAVVVAVRFRGSVLFRQARPGLHGRPFTLVKFRTMSNARDDRGRLLPDDQRLDAVGRFLRASSLDELPELWNVLRGDMSLVGPRPLLLEYLARYSPEEARRHDVKPGMTGWAQVNGRNAITWEQKFALDVWYAEHRTWRLDLKILVMTIWKVLGREGITEPGRATTTEFLGSR